MGFVLELGPRVVSSASSPGKRIKSIRDPDDEVMQDHHGGTLKELYQGVPLKQSLIIHSTLEIS